mmetsp:Transcript_62069/g.184739  ORF Transcript_62069/g.184739 Transcript_62069/m.184739 type:complete len:235 (-) Transcript_62069:95-799(-)
MASPTVMPMPIERAADDDAAATETVTADHSPSTTSLRTRGSAAARRRGAARCVRTPDASASSIFARTARSSLSLAACPLSSEGLSRRSCASSALSFSNLSRRCGGAALEVSRGMRALAASYATTARCTPARASGQPLEWKTCRNRIVCARCRPYARPARPPTARQRLRWRSKSRRTRTETLRMRRRNRAKALSSSSTETSPSPSVSSSSLMDVPIRFPKSPVAATALRPALLST